jgi:hypothetical protein
MTNLKFLVPLLISLLENQNKTQSDPSAALIRAEDSIRALIRREAMAIALRVFGGVVLSGVAIYCLVCVGQQINDLLLIMDFGPYYSLVGYSVLCILCIGGLFLLFKQPRRVESLATESITPALDIPSPDILSPDMYSPTLDIPPSRPGLDFNQLILSFYQGFNEGYQSRRARGRQQQAVKSELEMPFH